MGRGREARRWTAPVVAVALLLALGAGWWSKARCMQDGFWTGGEQYHGYCYTDHVALWHGRGLDAGDVPYVDSPVEYPVLLGGAMWLTAGIARAGPGAATAADYLDVNAAVMAALVLATAVLVRRIGVVLPPVVWWAALPVVAMTTFINSDALPVALLAAAILAHQRDRDGWSGVLVGLGAAAKLYPVFLLPLVVLTRLRQRRPHAAVRHLAAASTTWLVLNVPVALAAPEGWNRFLELSRERGPHVDSLWFAVDHLGGPALSGGVLNVVASGVFAVGAVALVVVGVRRHPPEATWVLVTPVVAWFLLTNKVYSPQYSLWVVALVAITLRRAAPFLAFAAADAAVHLVEFAVLGGRAGFTPAPGEGWLVLTTVARGATLAWVIVAILRDPAGPPERQRPTRPTSAIAPRLTSQRWERPVSSG